MNDIRSMMEITEAVKRVQSEHRYLCRATEDLNSAKRELNCILEKYGLETMSLEDVLSLKEEN